MLIVPVPVRHSMVDQVFLAVLLQRPEKSYLRTILSVAQRRRSNRMLNGCLIIAILSSVRWISRYANNP